jgi:hypothetical protein
MTDELKQSVEPHVRAAFALEDVGNIFARSPVRVFLDVPPEVRERLVEMADACEAFVRAWEGRER